MEALELMIYCGVFILEPHYSSFRRDPQPTTQAREIDAEVLKIVTHAYETSFALLSTHRDLLDEIANELLEQVHSRRRRSQCSVCRTQHLSLSSASCFYWR
eukprot:991623-Pleurochrysis_carterae.AAC.4